LEKAECRLSSGCITRKLPASGLQLVLCKNAIFWLGGARRPVYCVKRKQLVQKYGPNRVPQVPKAKG
jgi:hypothetical protein